MKFKLQKESELSLLEKCVSRIRSLDIQFPNFDLDKHKSLFLRLLRLKDLDIRTDIDYPFSMTDSFGELIHLEKLAILNFNFKEWPSWICGLKNLKSLMIRGNEINTFPQCIHQLANLKQLRIENCDISDFSSSIATLTNLRELSFADNKRLNTINPDYLPKSLKSLNLIMTGILPSQINQLKQVRPGLKINYSYCNVT